MIARKDILALCSRRPFLAYPWACSASAGFGANWSGLTKTLTACILKDIGFRLVRIARPSGIAIHKGYEDYFLPFCAQVDGFLLDRLNRSPLPLQGKLPVIKTFLGMYLRASTRPVASYFAFSDLSQVPSPHLPAYFLPEPTAGFAELRSWIGRALWEYQPAVATLVNTAKNEVSYLQNPYLALCVRRGDKIIEADYASLDLYVRAARAHSGSFRQAFLAGDDIATLELLASRLPEFECVILTPPFPTGYIHADFRGAEPELRLGKMARFFAQVELMRDSTVFIASRTTNVSWIVSVLRNADVAWVD